MLVVNNFWHAQCRNIPIIKPNWVPFFSHNLCFTLIVNFFTLPPLSQNTHRILTCSTTLIRTEPFTKQLTRQLPKIFVFLILGTSYILCIILCVVCLIRLSTLETLPFWVIESVWFLSYWSQFNYYCAVLELACYQWWLQGQWALVTQWHVLELREW